TRSVLSPTTPPPPSYARCGGLCWSLRRRRTPTSSCCRCAHSSPFTGSAPGAYHLTAVATTALVLL
ncbi:alpha/beta-Hydrolases superfamily protein, partial [Zea mays]